MKIFLLFSLNIFVYDVRNNIILVDLELKPCMKKATDRSLALELLLRGHVVGKVVTDWVHREVS